MAAGSPRTTERALFGAGVLLVLCCAVGPAVIGALAGSALGGWPGVACAIIVTAAAACILHRRAGGCGGC